MRASDRDDPRPEWDQPHLPPPWSAVQDEDDSRWMVVCDGFEDETPIVCVGAPNWPLAEADARILAASLDMLAALKGFNIKEADIVGGTGDALVVRVPVSVIVAVAQAIAKAEGRY